MTRGARWRVFAAHALATGWLFADALTGRGVFYFRDIAVYYFPNYVFVERALASGVWPLWNPWSDAGAPFLLAYPPDLLLVGALGARGALALGPPLHVLIAMCGAARLAERLGAGAWGSWLAGCAYGTSGFLLSTLNLFELSQGAALAPWVVAAALALCGGPHPRGIAVLGALAALQVSSLAAEMVLATLVTVLILARWWGRRVFLALLQAAALAMLLAAPALLGARALIGGTRRAGGFTAGEALGWSAHPLVLVEALLPRLFGDPHTFSELGRWGYSLFPHSYPYLLSLYAGVGVLLLALGAGRRHWRLWILVGLGLSLGLGSHGPLGSLLMSALGSFRSPVKFLVLAALPLALLAGLGLDGTIRARARRPLAVVAPGLLLLVLAALAAWQPQLLIQALSPALPEIGTWQAASVVRGQWPTAFLVSGVLATGAGLALAGSAKLAPLAAVLASLDLLIVNTPINTLAPLSFYTLRPEMAEQVAGARAEGWYRWFAYGAEATPGLQWSPEAARPNRDVALYAAERQSLLPRATILDGLEAALDEDRTGWAPQASTLTPAERRPERFREHYGRLRLANVRWVASFRELPPDLVTLRGEARVAEVLEPLHLYELRSPLPRAFWVARAERVADRAAALERSSAAGFDPRTLILEAADRPEPESGSEGPAEVVYEALGPHEIRLRVTSPPGWVAVLDGHHADWHADGGDGVERAYGRYRAIRTPGGERVIRLSYKPVWVPWSLLAAGLGAALAIGLALRPDAGEDRAASRERA